MDKLRPRDPGMIDPSTHHELNRDGSLRVESVSTSFTALSDLELMRRLNSLTVPEQAGT